MKTVKVIIVVVVIAASVAAPFWFHHRAKAALTAAENTGRDQAAMVAQLSSENERLSHPSAPALSDAQLKELLRLRNEVGRLRAAVAETKQLRATTGGGAPARPVPAGPNYWPKDQFSYAGYASPESTLKTALWAMKNGDINSMFSCMSPEIRAAFEQEGQKDGRSAAENENQFKEMAASILSGTAGVRLVDRTNAAPDQVMMRIAYDGLGVNQDFTLKKVGGGWKIQEAGGPELSDPGQ